MHSKLLSVIMPTFNRAQTISYNISLLKDQIKRNSEYVEFIICNDASSDDTTLVIHELLHNDPFFRYVDYSEHAEIGVNLARCIDEAEGKFFVFMGDDDIPAPFMVDHLLYLIKEYSDVECYHFNRMKADNIDGIKMKNLRVFYKDYEDSIRVYDNTEEFIINHFGGMCFLSVYMISTEAWRRGKAVYTDKHLGFEYLAPIFYGVNGKKCLFMNYPLCIQRCLKKPAYNRVWPAYLYLGIPRILVCLQENNVISNWKYVYKIYLKKAQENGQFNDSLIGYMNNMIYRASLDSKYYRQNLREINSYQDSVVRRCCTYFVWIPSWLSTINRGLIKIIMKLFGIE